MDLAGNLPDLPTYVAAALIENRPLQRSGRSVSPDRHREDVMTKRLILLTVIMILLVTSVSPMPGGATTATDLRPQAYLPLILSSIPARDVEIIFEFSPMTLAECESGSLSDQFIKELSAAAIYFLEGEDLFIDLKLDSGTMGFVPGG
jgi:hypothetical protein